MLHVIETTDGENCGFLRNRHDERLFYHISPTLGNRPLVVLCNPILEEQAACQRHVVSWLRYLARHRFNVLSFDYAGTGNSWGELTTCSGPMMDDLEDAIEWYQSINPVREIFLIGIRFGANIALHAAQRLDAAKLVGVEPILYPGRYWNNLLRSNLMTQLSIHGKVVKDRNSLMKSLKSGERINISGYEIDLYFADSIQSLRADAVEDNIKNNTLFFPRTRNDLKGARDMGFRTAEPMAESVCCETAYYNPNRTELFRKVRHFFEGRYA